MNSKGQVIPEVEFPIITIGSNGIVSFSQSTDSFTKWSKSVANNIDYWSSIVIIDSLGNQYKINDLKINGYTNIFWGLDLFLDQTVFVKLDMKLVNHFSVDKVKEIAQKLANANRDYYLSAGIKYDEVVKAIDSATLIKEIIFALSL